MNLLPIASLASNPSAALILSDKTLSLSDVPLLDTEIQSILSFPEISLPLSHPSLEKLKISQHIWKTLISPLISPQIEPKRAPIEWTISNAGEMCVTYHCEKIDDDSVCKIVNLLEQNKRLNDIYLLEGTLRFSIPSHYLPHLFFENPELLIQVCEDNLRLREALDPLLKPSEFRMLLSDQLEELREFKLNSNPGDYIVQKKANGYSIHYCDPNKVQKVFSFSTIVGSFSSFEGFKHIKTPFLLRNSSVIEQAKNHNACLRLIYQDTVRSLKKFSGLHMNNHSIGGIDAVIALEDLIAWHAFLQDDFYKEDLFLEILPYVGVLFAHFNNLKGEVVWSKEKINLEGMRRPPAKSEITEAALRFLPKTRSLNCEHSEIIYKMLKNTVKFSNKSDVVIDDHNGELTGDAKANFEMRNQEILDDLKKNIPVSISTGWAKHSIEITLYQSPQGKAPVGKAPVFMLYSNKGNTLHKDHNTHLYQVMETITTEKIAHLRKRPNMGPLGENKGAYFYAPPQMLKKIEQEMGGVRPKSMIEEFGLKEIDTIKKTAQKVGNCAVANGVEMLYNAPFLLRFTQLLEQKNSLTKAIKEASEYAKFFQREYILSQRVYQLGVWKYFSKFLNNSPKLAQKHFQILQMFSTAYVNKPGKIEKFSKYPPLLLSKSLIPEQIKVLKSILHNSIKDCSCDIIFCICSIPYNKGNRILKGPNGSFGLYKSSDFGSNKLSSPKFYLVLKSLTGKFETFPIFLNPNEGEEKYRISCIEGHSENFTTLGELATLVEKYNHQMIFAL